MRLIDADALFKNKYIIIRGEDGKIVAQQIIGILRDAPTIDAVPVVRCRECDWRDETNRCTNPHCTTSFYGCVVRGEHFCSYGERGESGCCTNCNDHDGKDGDG